MVVMIVVIVVIVVMVVVESLVRGRAVAYPVLDAYLGLGFLGSRLLVERRGEERRVPGQGNGGYIHCHAICKK